MQWQSGQPGRLAEGVASVPDGKLVERNLRMETVVDDVPPAADSRPQQVLCVEAVGAEEAPSLHLHCKESRVGRYHGTGSTCSQVSTGVTYTSNHRRGMCAGLQAV
jgi:hypothetical protein